MEYKVNDQLISYEAIGARHWGSPITLLNNAVDLTSKTNWTAEGFTIERLFNNSTYSDFKNHTDQLLRKLWSESSLDFPLNELLENYHRYIHHKEQHIQAVEFTKLISVNDFPIDIKILEERISELCQENLIVRNPFDGQRVFHFRVIRPNQPDNNPLHRDVWLEDYDNCINLYIPVAGSNELSSLVIAPGSHRWPESKLETTEGGAHIDNVKFNVPAVTAIKGEASFVRPIPKPNEVLVFSPYLVHGGAKNFNADVTRISLEVRLWRK